MPQFRDGGRFRGLQFEDHEYEPGYECDFVDAPLDQKYLCPICLAVLRDPYQTRCGHRFCARCLGRLRGGPLVLCPMEGSAIDKRNDCWEDKAMCREILTLHVRCRHHSAGCGWTGELVYITAHQATCEFVEIPCKLGCGEYYTKRTEVEHLEICGYRTDSCTYCGDSMKALQMPKHQILHCTHFPVKCNLCSKDGLIRSELAGHVDPVHGDCEEMVSSCRFVSLGCEYRGKRTSIVSHGESRHAYHLSLALDKLMSVDRHLTALGEFLPSVEISRSDTVVVQAPRPAVVMTTNGVFNWSISSVQEATQNRFTSPIFSISHTQGYVFSIGLDIAGSRQRDVMYAVVQLQHHPDPSNQLEYPVTVSATVTLSANWGGRTLAVSLPDCTLTRCAAIQTVRSGRVCPTSRILSGDLLTDGDLQMTARVTAHNPVTDEREVRNSNTPEVPCSSNQLHLHGRDLGPHPTRETLLADILSDEEDGDQPVRGNVSPYIEYFN